MSFAYHPRALAELEHETSWYEHRRTGLGHELAALVEDAVRRIVLTPALFPTVAHRPRFRRVVLHKFPLSVVYMLREGNVVIVALAHAKKRPGYWARRIP